MDSPRTPLSPLSSSSSSDSLYISSSSSPSPSSSPSASSSQMECSPPRRHWTRSQSRRAGHEKGECDSPARYRTRRRLNVHLLDCAWERTLPNINGRSVLLRFESTADRFSMIAENVRSFLRPMWADGAWKMTLDCSPDRLVYASLRESPRNEISCAAVAQIISPRSLPYRTLFILYMSTLPEREGRGFGSMLDAALKDLALHYFAKQGLTPSDSSPLKVFVCSIPKAREFWINRGYSDSPQKTAIEFHDSFVRFSD
eukprot:919699_1